MKLILSTACVLLSVAAFADTIKPHPSADHLLQDVVTQLPSDPITVSGNLLVRRRRGMPVATYLFELKANWGSNPPQATYTIDDSFGQTLEQLTITHGQHNSYQYSTGDPLQSTILESLSASIQQTDLSWMDLTLAFLWWTDGKIIGEESIRTFDCYIIKVNAPANSKSSYSSVKIWISKKSHLMLKAEGYNAKNKLVRRLWIKSCKKIKDQWMIKDMEIQKYPKKQITKLRVLDIKHSSKDKTNTLPSPYGQSLVVAHPQTKKQAQTTSRAQSTNDQQTSRPMTSDQQTNRPATNRPKTKHQTP